MPRSISQAADPRIARRTLSGFALSTVWCAVASWLWYRFGTASPTLSEVSDFIAGVIAPLGFFWLIVGYYQQGQELRENTEALSSQQVELERQATAMTAQTQALRDQNAALTRPYVVVRPWSQGGNWYHLRIENTGKTAAHGLRLTIDRPFYCANIDKSNLTDAYIFNEEIHTFAPGEQIDILLGHGSDIFGVDADRQRIPLSFGVEAQYSYGDQQVIEARTIDLEVFGGLHVEERNVPDELHKIGEALKARK